MSKKVIRLFCLPSHATKDRVSGVDMARIIQPGQHLNNYVLGDTKFKVHVYDAIKDEFLDWMEVAKKYDMIYLNYTALPWEFAKMGLMMRKAGKPMILDLDDSLWDIVQDNPAYEVYKKGSEALKNFTAIAGEVDYITTTNDYLANVIRHHTTQKNVEVFPNYIDLKLYNHRCKFKDTHEIMLLHHGSTTHFMDLQTEEFGKGIDKVFKRYPNVKLKTIGAMIPMYQKRWGMRYESGFGDVDVYKWIKNKFPKYMDETDILVVPLAENPYTICKSAIKFGETSSARVPGCYQDIRQYQEVIKHGKNGYLCKTADDWYNCISDLIENKERRRRMGKRAFETVLKDMVIEKLVPKYAKYFKDIKDNYEAPKNFL